MPDIWMFLSLTTAFSCTFFTLPVNSLSCIYLEETH
jgi:hypothetical protein